MSFLAAQRAYDNVSPPERTLEDERIDERESELRGDLKLACEDEAIARALGYLLDAMLDKPMTAASIPELRALSWRVERAISDRAVRDVSQV